MAIWAANSERLGGPAAAGAPIMDRAAVEPMARGESSYDRAVREALARERKAPSPGRRTATRS